MAAHNWRALRTRYADHGVGDVMAEVSTMHAVLDQIEQLGLEAATSGAKSPTEARAKITSYFDKLYRPDMTTKVIDGDGYTPPPPGFSDDEIEASFDAFLNTAGR